MSATTNWSQERIQHFWQLQTRARMAGLHLTAPAEGGFRIRTSMVDKGETHANLVDAELAIVAAENAGSSR
jgi:hypothetical protein